MIYDLIFFIILVLKNKFKKSGGFYLWIGFYLFLLSAVVNLAKFVDLSEVIIRVGLVFLLAGLVFVIREYKLV